MDFTETGSKGFAFSSLKQPMRLSCPNDWSLSLSQLRQLQRWRTRQKHQNDRCLKTNIPHWPKIYDCLVSGVLRSSLMRWNFLAGHYGFSITIVPPLPINDVTSTRWQQSYRRLFWPNFSLDKSYTKMWSNGDSSAIFAYIGGLNNQLHYRLQSTYDSGRLFNSGMILMQGH